jgi:uncharacterized protein (DUF433 family)
MSTATFESFQGANAPGRSSRELIPEDSPFATAMSVNPARMHGEPCFKGSRVPVQTLFDHLRAGDGFTKFLDGYEGVTREQVVAVIDLAARGLLAGLRLP